MTAHRSDPGVSFAWNEDVRARIERRALEIRRRRRIVFGSLGGMLAVVAVVAFAGSLAGSRPGDERVATTGPDPTTELAQLLPTPSSVAEVFPHLHVRALSGGRQYGVTTPAELVGAQGANLGVNRQWVSEPASVQLQPGQQFPDGVFSVISAVTRFDTAGAAQAWTRQSVAGVAKPVYLRGAGTTPDDLLIVRGPGTHPGELEYLAVFTHGTTAFTLAMIAGGSGGDDNQFVRLVQDWTRQTDMLPAGVNVGLPGDALAPPDASAPTAGACASPEADVVELVINADTPLPRCVKVVVRQRLRVTNSTSETTVFRLHGYELTLAPGESRSIDEPFGAYLAPGVHSTFMSAYAGGSGAQIWL